VLLTESAGGFGQRRAAQQGDAEVMADGVDRAGVPVGPHGLGDGVDAVEHGLGILFGHLPEGQVAGARRGGPQLQAAYLAGPLRALLGGLGIHRPDRLPHPAP
jgi:hypothetical protein